MKLDCVLCEYPASSELDLEAHITLNHQNIFSVFTDQEQMTELGNDKCEGFRCELCHALLDDPTQLDNHLERMHGILVRYEEKPTTSESQQPTETKSDNGPACEVCSKTFSNGYNLVRHVDTVHSKKTATPCGQCGKMLSSAQALKFHLQEVHSAEKKFPCKQCNKSFALKYRLTAHIKKHQSTRVRMSCNECGKSLSSATALKSHLQEVHSKIRNFRCQQCDRRFALKFCLASHIKSHHTAKVRSTGKQSGKLLVSATSLEAQPLDDQSSRNKLKCQKCNKSFDRKAKLESHNRSRCTNQTSGPCCDECGKALSSATALKSHLQEVHSNVRNFRCQQCFKGFALRFRLTSHIKRFH